MKVLHLTTYGYGGAGRACARLHQALRGQGVDSRMLVLDQLDSAVPEAYGYFGRQHWRLPLTRRLDKLGHWRDWGKPRGFDFFSPPRSVYRLHRHPLVKWADIINLHWVARWLDYPTFFTGIDQPVAWTLHDMNPFSGGYHYVKGFPMDAYATLIARNERIKEKALWGFDQLEIVTLNHWMYELSSHSDLFQRYGHHLIPNSLDTAVFRPRDKVAARRALGLPLDKQLLLFVADKVQNERKGIRYLLEAFPLLTRPDVAVVAVGDHPPQLANLPFYALGRIAEEERIAQVYAAADVFVIPSIEDNLPNTVLESLSAGTPVVGFRIGGIPDMVRDGENGFLA
ncbi:MAG: glycosyltransferase, partial [Lewinella sp.]|nr:glycosyltransferase [Lewinella sp.]